MLASKMPSLRIDQSELKCKNGCDFYGNPQWQGYCSICHRDLMSKQRRAEKASSSSSSATLPKPESKKPERLLKLSSNSSFSKFEEKRQKQSETLKKANILKFSLFTKSSHDDHEQVDKKQAEFKIPQVVFENMKREFRVRFPQLSQQADRDTRVFVQSLVLDVLKHANAMSVDERADRVQRQYQVYMKRLDTSPYYAAADADTKELLIDFVEKHAMSYLHELPAVVFSPSGTEDERLDRVMSERIQQLGWVAETHLESPLDKNNPLCRQLLYQAISELLGMDSAVSPGGKLSHVRRCCSHVVSLCRTDRPASADDLLPAIIFTVLKANPPRLVSNINFVTRFCNAQRLMTGEGGYYFTNLCCAVSFIENLTAESLNMDKKEFDCYMAMPASIGGSSWAAALSLSSAGQEQAALTRGAEQLLTHAALLSTRALHLAADTRSLAEEIEKKVKDVLAKTPLEILPRRELPSFEKFKQISAAPLVDVTTNVDADDVTREQEPSTELKQTIATDETDHRQTEEPQKTEPDIFTLEPSPEDEDLDDLKILGFGVQKDSPSKSPENPDQGWDAKNANSLELLTPSPLGFARFDSRSMDELMTPDDLAPGLSNINYDIDLSDFSGDNSIAEDAPKVQASDPFSPDGIKKDANFDPFAIPAPMRETTFDPFAPVPNLPKDPFSPIRDQFSLGETSFDPFAPLETMESFSAPRASTSADPFSPDRKTKSILDDSDSPTADCLLPSPLLPQSSGTSK